MGMMMDDIFDKLSGFDIKNETINLWYEVNYLRHCLNAIIKHNPGLTLLFDKDELEKCKQYAQQEVRDRFPLLTIDFTNQKTAEERVENISMGLKEFEDKIKKGLVNE